MLEQELKDIWKNSSQEEKISFDLSQLMVELNRKIDRLKKIIHRRDLREIGASIFGIIGFSYLGYEIPFPITKIACVLTIGWFFYVIYKLRKNKKQKITVDISLPFVEQMTNQKANLLRELQLLKSVLYWYVIPPVIFNILFIFGFGNPAEYEWNPWLIKKLTLENSLYLLPIALNVKLLYISGTLLFNVFIIWINKRAVRISLLPLIENADTIISELEDEN